MNRSARRWSLRSAQSKARRLSVAARPALVEALESRTMLTTIVVNTTVADIDLPSTGLIGIENAITTAETNYQSSTTITFDPTIFATAPQTIVCPELLLSSINSRTTIIGPAVGVTLSDTDVEVDPNVSATFSNVNIVGLTSDVTISQNGTFTLSNGSVEGGAGISNLGNLTLANVTVAGNADGGINNGAGATATLTDCTVSGNSYATGGGIYNDGKLTMTNDTVADNTATTAGGGIYNDTTGNATLINVTVADNSFVGNVTVAGTEGGGICNLAATKNFRIGNSIVAENKASLGPQVYGGFNSQGYNLIGNTYASTGWNTADYTGTNAGVLDAGLNGLADNGGPTPTMQPTIGSVAIDHGSNALIGGVTTDQRGQPRIYAGSANGNVDIGAVEGVESPLINLTVTNPGSQTAVVGQSPSAYFSLGSFTESNAPGPFTVTVNWGDGTPNTVFSMSAPGTIPATPHVYTSVGEYTASVTVQDGSQVYPCDTSNVPSFGITAVLPSATASISGTVNFIFLGNGTAPAVMTYLDMNNDDNLDKGDPTCVTDSTGYFSFTGLSAGNYTVREVVPAGYTLTAPQAGYTVALANAQAMVGQNFTDSQVSVSTEQAVYRLYSPVTFEHLYTSDLNEYTTLATRGGWIQEGMAYYDYSGQATIGGVSDEPLYRLYNPFVRQHLWTTQLNEYNTLATEGWTQEGIAGWVFPSAVAGTATDPLYRLSYATPALHLWTTDLNEYNTLAADDFWTQEGIVCYVL